MKQILLGVICALVGVSAFGQTAKQRIDYLVLMQRMPRAFKNSFGE